MDGGGCSATSRSRYNPCTCSRLDTATLMLSHCKPLGAILWVSRRRWLVAGPGAALYEAAGGIEKLLSSTNYRQLPPFLNRQPGQRLASKRRWMPDRRQREARPREEVCPFATARTASPAPRWRRCGWCCGCSTVRHPSQSHSRSTPLPPSPPDTPQKPVKPLLRLPGQEADQQFSLVEKFAVG
jgi:hypothetical protein